MGFWDKQDKRYTQARSALIFSVVAVGVSAVLVAAIVMMTARKQSQPRKNTIEMSAEAVEVPMPTPRPADLKQARISAWQEQLLTSVQENHWPEAEVLARQILNEDPENGTAWVALAQAQSQTGREQEAMDSLSRALSDQESAPYALYLRSTLLRKNGDLQSAIVDLERASELDPGSIAIWNILLLAKIEAGRDQEVRNIILGYVKAGIPSQESRWLLPAAAMALKDEKPGLAARFFEAFEQISSASLSAELLADPIFDPYRDEERWRHLFAGSRKNEQKTSERPGTSPAAGQ